MVTVTTILAQMLMYGKEASNRKQEIDCQHHTIPNQKTSTVEMCITCYSVMEKLKCSFSTFCKQTFPQLHKIASYAHSHSADYYGISYSFISLYIVWLTVTHNFVGFLPKQEMKLMIEFGFYSNTIRYIWAEDNPYHNFGTNQ